jgi:hypothetical protein
MLHRGGRRGLAEDAKEPVSLRVLCASSATFAIKRYRLFSFRISNDIHLPPD